MGEKSSFSLAALPDSGGKYSTWTPKIPKIMKKAQQMRTIFPIGLKEEIKVSTTSFRPGALLMTLGEKKDKTRKLLILMLVLLPLSCFSSAHPSSTCRQGFLQATRTFPITSDGIQAVTLGRERRLFVGRDPPVGCLYLAPGV